MKKSLTGWELRFSFDPTGVKGCGRLGSEPGNTYAGLWEMAASASKLRLG
jgi:hypothetical protein